jgi:putative membrane protein
MITYDAGKWHISFAFTKKGSVIPRSFMWGMPALLLTLVIHIVTSHFTFFQGYPEDTDALSQGWAGYNFVLGFLLVFRTQQGYARFWEGATLIERVRGMWFNAMSSLFAFTSTDPERLVDVRCFQHATVRLASLLFCTSLKEVSDANFDFNVLDTHGLDPHALQYLHDQVERPEIVLQWIQRFVVSNGQAGLINVPAPILTRVFQELGQGITEVRGMMKIKKVLFPFPYAQVLSTLLIVHVVATPIVCARIFRAYSWSLLLAFLNVSLFWCINYIAGELENPFGSDANDLPLTDYCESMNVSLSRLLDPRVQNPPTFEFDRFTLNSWEVDSHPYESVVDVLAGQAKIHHGRSKSLYEGSDRFRRLLSVGIGDELIRSDQHILDKSAPSAPTGTKDWEASAMVKSYQLHGAQFGSTESNRFQPNEKGVYGAGRPLPGVESTTLVAPPEDKEARHAATNHRVTSTNPLLDRLYPQEVDCSLASPTSESPKGMENQSTVPIHISAVPSMPSAGSPNGVENQGVVPIDISAIPSTLSAGSPKGVEYLHATVTDMSPTSASPPPMCRSATLDPGSQAVRNVATDGAPCNIKSVAVLGKSNTACLVATKSKKNRPAPPRKQRPEKTSSHHHHHHRKEKDMKAVATEPQYAPLPPPPPPPARDKV